MADNKDETDALKVKIKAAFDLFDKEKKGCVVQEYVYYVITPLSAHTL